MTETTSRREYSKAGNMTTSLTLFVAIISAILMFLDLRINMKERGSERSEERSSDHQPEEDRFQAPEGDREIIKEEEALDEPSEVVEGAPPIPSRAGHQRIGAGDPDLAAGVIVLEAPPSLPRPSGGPISSHHSREAGLRPRSDQGEDGGVEESDRSPADDPSGRVEAKAEKRETRSKKRIDRHHVVTPTSSNPMVDEDEYSRPVEAEPIQAPEMSVGENITVVGCGQSELIGSIQPMQIPDASLSILSGKVLIATVEVHESGEGVLVGLEGELITPFLRSRAESAVAQAHWTSPGFGCSAWVTVRFVFP